MTDIQLLTFLCAVGYAAVIAFLYKLYQLFKQNL